MFDLINKDQPEVRDERHEVDKGFKKFETETGYNFFELLNNKNTRARMLIGGLKNEDTNDDELISQRIFGKFQKDCWEGED
ncbi:hypothetical protein HMSSN036_52510 [Paenibacillus macerans]|nr:hypothetical protein HMSSN036_52510 [Paenibacillus macerans]